MNPSCTQKRLLLTQHIGSVQGLEVKRSTLSLGWDLDIVHARHIVLFFDFEFLKLGLTEIISVGPCP